jgi:hypothetical protein
VQRTGMTIVILAAYGVRAVPGVAASPAIRTWLAQSGGAQQSGPQFVPSWHSL